VRPRRLMSAKCQHDARVGQCSGMTPERCDRSDVGDV
jgi:hypothetical protein